MARIARYTANTPVALMLEALEQDGALIVEGLLDESLELRELGELNDVDMAAVITYQRNAFGNNMGDMVQPIDVYNRKKG